MLDFHDVRVILDADRFRATVADRSATFEGRWSQAGGRWLALVVC